MPAGLDPGDRRLLIVFGAVLVLLVVGTWLATAPEPDPFRGSASTYSNAGGGARAAYLLLEDLGYYVERWRRPPAELPADPELTAGTVLVLADAFPGPAASDRAAIRNFLRAGGRVLAAGFFAEHFLHEAEEERAAFRFPVPTGMEHYETDFRPVAPGPLTRSVRRIHMPAFGRWERREQGQVELFGDEHGAVVVTYPVGQGRVIWWQDSAPLTNRHISQQDNLALLLNSLGPPEEVTVLWDEYFHGYGDSLVSYFWRTPAPWFVLQVLLVFAAVLVTFARRSGPVRLPAAEPRLSPLEFVETLGDLYHRAGAARTALETGFLHFRGLLARRLGLPANTPIRQLYQGARERLGWREPGLYETLHRAEQGLRDPELDSREALRLVQSLDHYQELLRLKPRTQEKP